jgi:multiple sugar transport system ATP-binding protein
MDEPLSDLDAKLKTELRVEIQRINKELDQTIVYVTHDQEEAMTMSTSIGVMNNGTIVQRAKPEELFQNPNNRFVSQFIGQPSMNLLDVTIDGQGEISYEGLVLGRIMDSEKLEMIEPGRSYEYCFRPSHTEVTKNTHESIIPVELSIWEPLGSTYILYLESVNGREIKVISEQVPDISESKRVGISNIQQSYLFDKETGDTVVDLRDQDLEFNVGKTSDEILDAE